MTSPSHSPAMDTPDSYGIVTRTLHWSMAAIFAWQFTGATLHFFIEDAPVRNFFWSTHSSLGVLLLVLVFLRGAWGLANLSRRPSYQAGILGCAAAAGHILLYALMLAVPVLAVLRSYGRGRGLSVFGVQVFEARGTEIPHLIAPGAALHGLLGWTLLALVVGHIVMALVHHYALKDGALTRMARGQEAA
ncbi:cytochrome b [Bordetella petrii]|uniref:cytochrome b n=1 Tax=Bordetella petrii TaxID=94624 RepID=UPI001E5FEE73|nr:cytochrome b [Bordetella petrii]MCD0503228.1 cytochrome b [Bordetella petrii]